MTRSAFEDAQTSPAVARNRGLAYPTVEKGAAKFGVPVCPHAGGVGLCEYVQHLAIFDYIAVSGSPEDRTCEFVDHLHEHFVHPARVKSGRYVAPTAPGYSAEDALTRCRRVVGDDHLFTLISATVLAATLWELGQYEPARQLAEDTLTRYRQVLGEDHPSTLGAAHSLAAVLRELGHYEQARQLGEDTLTRYRQVVGEDYPSTLGSAHSLAAVLANRGATPLDAPDASDAT